MEVYNNLTPVTEQNEEQFHALTSYYRQKCPGQSHLKVGMVRLAYIMVML